VGVVGFEKLNLKKKEGRTRLWQKRKENQTMLST
jgi:hypothetical protein